MCSCEFEILNYEFLMRCSIMIWPNSTISAHWMAENLSTASDRGVKDIRRRSFDYAIRAVRLYRFLENRHDGASRILGRQYLRAACSIGANVEEAQSGESRADFIHKLSIAQKEARESLYWLRLLAESELFPEPRLNELLKETKELVAVVTSIIVTTKRTPRSRLDS